MLLLIGETIIFSSLIYFCEMGVANKCIDSVGYPSLEAYKTACLLPMDDKGLATLCYWDSLTNYCRPRFARQSTKVPSDEYESPFRSIPHSMYWVFTTITTVGYGDIYPTELQGLIAASMCMLSGVIVVAIFVIVIGRNFEMIEAKQHNMQEVKNSKKHMWEMTEQLEKLKEDERLGGGEMPPEEFRPQRPLGSSDDEKSRDLINEDFRRNDHEPIAGKASNPPKRLNDDKPTGSTISFNE